MTSNILEQVAENHPFVPSNSKYFLALKISQKLRDLENLKRYLIISEHFPKELLLKAYLKARDSESPSTSFFAFFHN
jgi:hypothetical protein